MDGTWALNLNSLLISAVGLFIAIIGFFAKRFIDGTNDKLNSTLVSLGHIDVAIQDFKTWREGHDREVKLMYESIDRRLKYLEEKVHDHDENSR